MTNAGTDDIGRGSMLTAAEFAEQFKVGRSSVYRWMREGTIPSVQVGGTVRIPAWALVDRLSRGRRG